MACVTKTWHLSLTCHMHFQGVVFGKEELLTVASRPPLPNISTDPIPKLEDLKLSLHQTSTFYFKLPFPKACGLDVLSSVQSNPWVIKSSASKSLDTPSCCEICCFNSSTVLQDPRSCPDSAQRATSGADAVSEAITF